MDNSNRPNPETPPVQPFQPTEQPAVVPPLPAPTPALTPADTAKSIRNGWILFAAAVVVSVAGIALGYAVAAGALLSALAGRFGLQAKNKPLAITGITFAVIMLIIFGLATFLG